MSMNHDLTTAHKKLRVLVTRPHKQAQPLLRLLQDRGYDILHFPCLSIVPITADSVTGRQCRLRASELDRYQHIIIVSANAATCWLPWVDRYWTQRPMEVHWWAMGEATRYRLQLLDITAQRPNRGDDSEALLASLLPQLKASDRVLIVRGVGGRGAVAEACRAHSVQVDYAECYSRQMPPASQADIACVTDYQPSVILCQSGETLVNFNRMMTRQLGLKQHQIMIVVPSQRVADIAYDLGFGEVKISSSASDQAMCDVLDQGFDILPNGLESPANST